MHSGRQGAALLRRLGAQVAGQGRLNQPPFADRLAALVEERESQVCLGLDPDPADLRPAASAAGDELSGTAAERAAAAVAAHCRELIGEAGEACVAVKIQLACFERLGAPGWEVLSDVTESAWGAGLLVIVDGKRGDVHLSAAAYSEALVGRIETPWGPVGGLGADAFTANPLLGADSLEPMIEAAEAAAAGIFCLVRTSNLGAADLQDLDAGGVPLHERIAAIVAERSQRLAGSRGLSGMGAVVGGTEPQFLGRLRELMPDSIFLVPGIGAQGGDPTLLGPAIAADRPASILVNSSRGIAGAADPGAAAEELREALWELAA